MSVSKDPERGTFYVQCRYKDWTGAAKKKTKRGFKTEKEARAWEYEFLRRIEGAPTMLFSEFYEVYAEDTKPRIRLNTWQTKAALIEGKILPYLGNKRVNEITPLDGSFYDYSSFGNSSSYCTAIQFAGDPPRPS